MYQAIYYDRSTYTYHLRDDEKGWLDFKYTPELYQITPNGPLETFQHMVTYPTFGIIFGFLYPITYPVCAGYTLYKINIKEK